jgi:hypothetical protein
MVRGTLLVATHAESVPVKLGARQRAYLLQGVVTGHVIPGRQASRVVEMGNALRGGEA